MSFNPRPNNWYSMSYEQQREWERQDRRLEDEHWEAQRARDDASHAQQAAANARREAAQVRASAAEEIEGLQDEINKLNEQLDAMTAERDSLLSAIPGIPGTSSENPPDFGGTIDESVESIKEAFAQRDQFRRERDEAQSDRNEAIDQLRPVLALIMLHDLDGEKPLAEAISAKINGLERERDEAKRNAELYADNIRRTMDVRDEYKRERDEARNAMEAAQAEHMNCGMDFEVLKRQRDGLLEALQGLGVMPEGYCFCYGHQRDPNKPEHEHTGECRAARAAIAQTETP